jgi:hypothetical protein
MSRLFDNGYFPLISADAIAETFGDRITVQSIIDIAADLAECGESLWPLIRDNIIPDETSRVNMLRDAREYEVYAGAAYDYTELVKARRLRQFLKSAPVGLSLAVGVCVDKEGNVTSYPNPSLFCVA